MANKDYHALVDMGSNGIRFSITDLSPACARSLPQIHHHRAPISLHDAQFSAGSADRQPLSSQTIDAVIASFKSFQRVCNAHGVPAQNVKVVATEATRTAPNATDFLAAIKQRVGWQDINLLPKEEEARLGAFGIAASVPKCRGLVLDLGGGSVQLSWVRTRDDGAVPDISEAVVSLPYGAAALMKRLEGADKKGETALMDEVAAEMSKTLAGLDLPVDLKDAKGRIPVFLSGGGFRGWGYLLMASHPDSEYPIQIISGYSVSWDEFTDFKRVEKLIRKRADMVAEGEAKKEKKGKKKGKESMEKEGDTGIHRISARRLSQLPAIKLVVSALESALNTAKLKASSVTFCAGGVPTGLLYTQLPTDMRSRSAIAEAATLSSTHHLNISHLQDVLSSSLPAAPTSIQSILHALALLLSTHAPLPKDIRASAALRFPITGSPALGSALGIDHAQRAALALALCARWGGESELPVTEAADFARLRAVAGADVAWWAEVVGRLAALLVDLVAHGGLEVVSVSGDVESDEQARGCLKIRIGFAGADESAQDELVGLDAGQSVAEISGSGLGKGVRALEKMGKKKNWVVVDRDGRPEAYGLRIEVALAKNEK